MYTDDENRFADAEKRFIDATTITKEKPEPEKLILGKVE